jgi:hypothetical protein
MMHLIVSGLTFVAASGLSYTELSSPCMPASIGSAILESDGLTLRDSEQRSGDRGELFELWQSAAGDKWAAVIYLAEEDIRCLVASRLEDYGA